MEVFEAIKELVKWFVEHIEIVCQNIVEFILPDKLKQQLEYHMNKLIEYSPQIETWTAIEASDPDKMPGYAKEAEQILEALKQYHNRGKIFVEKLLNATRAQKQKLEKELNDFLEAVSRFKDQLIEFQTKMTASLMARLMALQNENDTLKV